MRYCTRCVLPDTRPNLQLGPDGVCNACRAHARKASIDWKSRERAFRNVVYKARGRSAGYDCVIPVSGGKDSHWQVATCLEWGLKPLAVTWRPPGRTPLGEANLDNLIALGVDHIDYSIDPAVERAFTRKALIRLGSPATPMHMAIFAIPLTIAAKFEIPLVVWGENSAFEYGSSTEEDEGFRLTPEWVSRYGVTQGTIAGDWVDEELTEGDLVPYQAPAESELEEKRISAIFLGYYFQWDPERSLEVARRHGFRKRDAGARTGFYDYADIDDEFISVHHFLKWYKFGFTRTFDNLSIEIRHGRITREAAIETIRELGDEIPHEDIAAFCRFIEMDVERFFEVVERFRNEEIWQREDGVWRIPDFLIDDWEWS